MADHFASEDHRGKHGGYVGAKEVGAHTGYVAHVVAHVVGDGGGVAGVVFGDSGFYLTHEVGTHVGRLGVNAAAYPGEERNGFRTQREAREDLKSLRHVGVHSGEYDVEGSEAQYREAGYAEAHNGSARERHLEGLRQRSAGSLCGAHVGLGSDVHADPTGEGTKYRSDHEGYGDHPVGVHGDGFELRRPGQKRGRNHDKNAQNAPLRTKEGLGSAGNVAGEFDHVGVSGVLLADPNGLKDHDDQAYEAEDGNEVLNFHIIIALRGLVGLKIVRFKGREDNEKRVTGS